MPGYYPELNPKELLNQDVKAHGLGKSRPTTRTELMATVRSHLYRRQKQPQIITNLFREHHVRYAAWGTTHYLRGRLSKSFRGYRSLPRSDVKDGQDAFGLH
jgi:hypothetical protein